MTAFGILADTYQGYAPQILHYEEVEGFEPSRVGIKTRCLRPLGYTSLKQDHTFCAIRYTTVLLASPRTSGIRTRPFL